MKQIIFIFILFSAVIDSYSQNLTKGLIIRWKDTVDVSFDIPVGLNSEEILFRKIQRKIKYYNIKGKKKVLKPSDASEIHIYFKGDTIRMLTREDFSVVPCETCIKRYAFLKVVVEGELSLFEHHISPGMYGSLPWQDLKPGDPINNKGIYYYYQKGNSQLSCPTGYKRLIEYFSDCKELVKWFNDKEYRKRYKKSIKNNEETKELLKIVNFYNTNCAQ